MAECLTVCAFVVIQSINSTTMTFCSNYWTAVTDSRQLVADVDTLPLAT